MPGSKKPVYYWDTCIFFAWLKDEDLPSEVMDGIESILAENRKDHNIIITSSITLSELLEGKIDRQKEELFQECIKRPNLIMVGVDPPVALEARRIRDYYYLEHNKTGRTVSTPDALHLATAIINDADEFHTLDQNNTRTGLGLLPLNGDVAGVNLAICKPYKAKSNNEELPETGQVQIKMKYDKYRESRYDNGWLICGRSGGSIFIG